MNPSTIVHNVSSSGCNSARTIRISSSSRSNKFQKLEIDNPPDVLIVYVESDKLFIEQKLIPVLKNDGIRYDTLHDRGTATDSTFFHGFKRMMNNRTRVLFILSESFSSSPTFSRLPSIAVHYINNENVVCLLVDDNVKFEDNLRFLPSTRCVFCSKGDWETYLLKHLRIRSPHFARMIDPRSVSQCLHHHGLGIRHLNFDIYGLFVELNNTTVHVDVEEFRRHMQEHTSIGTNLACTECSLLCTPGSTVRFIFGNNFKQNEDSEKFDRVMTHLCSNIFDIPSSRKADIPFTLGCTLMGRPVHQYIRKLWLKIICIGFAEIIAKEQKIKYPENGDEETRCATFPESWHSDDVPTATSLAQAGFYFCRLVHAPRCFMCGFYFETWRKDYDPMLIHAAINQFCPLVQENMSDVSIQRSLQRSIDSRYQINDMYASLSSRMTSFDKEANKLFEHTRICELSEAGFYHTGPDDVVTCFACGIMLTKMSSNKRVLVTHARLSPNCPYVKATKGSDYIEDILSVVGQAVPQTTVTFMLRKFDNREESCSDIFMFAPTPPRSKEQNTYTALDSHMS